jgi:hypothetical protein
VNPIRLFKIYKRANKLANLLQEAQVSKSLFTSKTFWVNIISAGLELSQILPIPSGYLTLGTNIANIILRTITTTPVHIVN